MASDLVRTKDLPVVDQYTDVSMDDRVIASHVTDGDNRETVGITVGALGNKFVSEAESSGVTLFPKNYYGTTAPSDEFGNDGDLYFRISDDVLDSGYFKIEGMWKQFKLSDDNWDRFLAGDTFDLISNARSVKAYAFQDNKNIRRVIMPKCETVYEYAFKKSSITELNMPKLETIYESAFEETKSWNWSIYTPNKPMDLSSVKTIQTKAFYSVHSSGASMYMNIENVESIGNRAFYEASSINFTPYDGVIQKLILPKCKSIGNRAFGAYLSNYRHSFHDIILESIESIDTAAFENCKFIGVNENSHAIIVFGENIDYIGTSIFSDSDNCGTRGEDPDYPGNLYGLYMDMYVKATTPPTLNNVFRGKNVKLPDTGADAFVRDLMPNIYVPEESVSLYKTTGKWKVYADYIQAIPPEGVPGYDNQNEEEE